MSSILEQEYIKQDRPFSQKELQYNRNKVFRKLRIGTTRAYHKRCSHFYYVKDNGRKEKEIKEANSSDSGNCSVCWKFNTTPKYLKTRARNLIDEYCRTFYESPTHLTHADVDLETSFVKWLYEESIN